jgi:hypothetical protein
MADVTERWFAAVALIAISPTGVAKPPNWLQSRVRITYCRSFSRS